MTINSSDMSQLTTDVLVVGAGIAGITSAVELSETGKNVMLIERNPYIGGRVVQMNQYFPKLCPPACGIEINLKRLRNNPGVKILTLTEVVSISGSEGNFKVTLKKKPRYINDNCTSCRLCEETCPVSRKDDFNYGMNTTKAVFLPYGNAYPGKYVIDMNSCKGTSCGECLKVCSYNAINLEEKEEIFRIETTAIIWATGWTSYNAAKLDNLGFGKFPDVVTNTMLERMAAPDGPNGGKILRPSDNNCIDSVAFVQCAGSRDENHLPYCSSVCCMASMKQATYIRERYPDAEIHFFFIDVRSPGRFEDFYSNLKKDEKMFFHRGKVAKVEENKTDSKMVVEAEDTLSGELRKTEASLVVLAVGMVPNLDGVDMINGISDENGFIREGNEYGIIGAGVARQPTDVSGVVKEATGAAMKAIQQLRRKTDGN